MENKLTVIIPTIVRDTIHRTIASIDIPCNILVIVDDAYSDKELIIDDPRVKIHRHSGVKGPGANKNYGISLVTTEYFTIQDDDDEFVNGYLKFAMDWLNNSEYKWLTTHHISGSFENTIEMEEITPENFLNKYFNWDNYSDNFLNMVYPNGGSIFHTSTWRAFGANFDIDPFFCDDVKAPYDFCSNHLGLNHKGFGHIVHVNNDSVSKEVSQSDIDKVLSRFKSKKYSRVLHNINRIIENSVTIKSD